MFDLSAPFERRAINSKRQQWHIACKRHLGAIERGCQSKRQNASLHTFFFRFQRWNTFNHVLAVNLINQNTVAPNKKQVNDTFIVLNIFIRYIIILSLLWK